MQVLKRKAKDEVYAADVDLIAREIRKAPELVEARRRQRPPDAGSGSARAAEDHHELRRFEIEIEAGSSLQPALCRLLIWQYPGCSDILQAE